MHRRAVVLGIACTALLTVGAPPARAADPVYRCLQGVEKVMAGYADCQHKVLAAVYGFVNGDHAVLDRKCLLKLNGGWARLQRQLGGTGTFCDGPRFRDDGDGTVFDRLTGLHWEQKTDDGGIHDKDDVYTWSANLSGNADGGAFTTFLRTLNASPCFAAQCDWRLPTRAELLSLMTVPCDGGACIDPIFGPTANEWYWSSELDRVNDLTDAWAAHYVAFLGADTLPRVFAHAVRAVRGGS